MILRMLPLFLPLALCLGDAMAAEPAYALSRDATGATLKAPDGRTVLRYETKKAPDSKLSANSACYFHPLTTPSGLPVTDAAPSDHRHHRGIFLAWYAMHGAKDADFWGWGQFAPVKGRVIENRGVKLAAADAKHADLAIDNDWLAEGEVMLKEHLAAAVRQQDVATVLDLVYTLTATADTKIDQASFGGFSVRTRKDGQFAFVGPEGEVKRPVPHYLKPETDWPAAEWYGCTLKLADGKTVGLVVIDHPENPPALWHNNRGVWFLNPCITAPGPLVLKKGEPLVLRYRVVAHDGPTPAALINALAAEWRRG
jgi:hypothetical protein